MQAYELKHSRDVLADLSGYKIFWEGKNLTGSGNQKIWNCRENLRIGKWWKALNERCRAEAEEETDHLEAT